MCALAVPVSAGIIYLVSFEAPDRFVFINELALIVSLAAIAFGRITFAETTQRIIAIALLSVFALPLLTGPEVAGTSRWIALGGVSLQAGMFALPLLARIAASDTSLGPWLMIASSLIAFAQPDFASALVVAVATSTIAIIRKDLRYGAVATLSLFAAFGASLTPNLAPQPFVEGVLPQVCTSSPIAALALVGSLLFTAVLILRHVHWPTDQRASVVASLVGFSAAALIGDYPTP